MYVNNNSFYCYYNQNETLKEPVIVIQQYKRDGDFLSFPRSLRELQPKYIVMYDANMTAVRQIEVIFIIFDKIIGNILNVIQNYFIGVSKF